MNGFKVFAVIALFAAVAFAADEPAKDGEETIKVYKRLIPADVLRGKLSLHTTSFGEFGYASESVG